MFHDLSKLQYLETLVLGYQIVYMPNHPHANKTGGWVYLHRIIMENKIERYLESKEIVHHIDENRSNNKEENLQLLSWSDHSKLHMGIKEPKTCKQCGKEFIYKYSSNLNIFCSSECSHKNQERIKWPSLEIIRNMQKSMSMVKIGKELGVSDNAVRNYIKRCKKLGSDA
jgi:predicted Zn-ribbon and HTH transcriptional regulator